MDSSVTIPGPAQAQRLKPTAFARVWGAMTARIGRFAGWRVVRLGQRLITQSHVALYRLLGGGPMAHLGTAPILLLTTTGRRSGKARTTPVIYVPTEPPVLVASNSGARSDPLWYRNLCANPRATVTLGRERRTVVAEKLGGAARSESWLRAVEIYPPYARYQQNTSREIPVVALREA